MIWILKEKKYSLLSISLSWEPSLYIQLLNTIKLLGTLKTLSCIELCAHSLQQLMIKKNELHFTFELTVIPNCLIKFVFHSEVFHTSFYISQFWTDWKEINLIKYTIICLIKK